jgi:2-(1,2-epoxy-1,2-dihydrophenyl)acetyl-CoA isomerase
MSAPLLVEREDGVLRWTLNRPERRNALDATLKAALFAALADAEADPPHVLVLRGAGGAFCAGQDLAERRGAVGADLGRSIREVYAPLITRLRRLPCVSLAVMDGAAAGAGAGLALACDIVLAARGARFLFTFVELGLAPDAGTAWLLARALGPARARAHLLLGAPLTAEAAATAGLVWEVAEPAELGARADELAAGLRTRSLPALLTTRALVDAAAERTLAAHLAAEAEAQERLGDGDAYRAAVARFLGRARGG